PVTVCRPGQCSHPATRWQNTRYVGAVKQGAHAASTSANDSGTMSGGTASSGGWGLNTHQPPQGPCPVLYPDYVSRRKWRNSRLVEPQVADVVVASRAHLGRDSARLIKLT